MILRPLFVARLAHAVLGAAVAFAGIGVHTDIKGAGGAVLAGLLFLASAYIAARSLRMRVRLGDGRVEVFGLLWSRHIPASAVTEVTDFPAIRWRAAGDRPRWTPVTGLMSQGVELEFIARHNREQVRHLRQWVKGQHP